MYIVVEAELKQRGGQQDMVISMVQQDRLDKEELRKQIIIEQVEVEAAGMEEAGGGGQSSGANFCSGGGRRIRICIDFQLF